MIAKMIAFLDQFSIEPRLYMRVRHLYRDLKFEIEWQQRKGGGLWLIREPLGDWQTQPSNLVIDEFNQLGIDLSQLEAQLREYILSQSVGAHLLIDQITELLGDESVNQALDQYAQFAKALTKKVSDILG